MTEKGSGVEGRKEVQGWIFSRKGVLVYQVESWLDI